MFPKGTRRRIYANPRKDVGFGCLGFMPMEFGTYPVHMFFLHLKMFIFCNYQEVGLFAVLEIMSNFVDRRDLKTRTRRKKQ